ncbi:hypothetical protein GCM10022252_76010 [Streptosporangium oxazolinicum]|uniref:Single-stranded DNA-binding protein n=1 Tax=Streptosporangium oxazolinicum TaxID=909287 RepID=A0ABP8BLG5_9ACTN
MTIDSLTPLAPAGQPPLIFQRMAGVMADIKPIAMNGENKEVGYKFRSIEDVMNAVHAALVKHEVLPIPHKVVERNVYERGRETGRPAGRQAQTGPVVVVAQAVYQYRFYTVDGSFIEAEIPAEATDTADKATNKTLTAAYKYLLLQSFAIPFEATMPRGSGGMYDGDADHIERPGEQFAEQPAGQRQAPAPAPEPPYKPNNKRAVAAFVNRIGKGTTEPELDEAERDLREMSAKRHLSEGDKKYVWNLLEKRRGNLGLPLGPAESRGQGEGGQAPAAPAAPPAEPAAAPAEQEEPSAEPDAGPAPGEPSAPQGEGFVPDDADAVELFGQEIAGVSGEAAVAQLDSIETTLHQLKKDQELTAGDHAHLMETLRLSRVSLGLPEGSSWQPPVLAGAGVAE